MTFVQGFGPLSLAPTFPVYMEVFDSSLADVVKFTGVAILVLGFSNFIWVPISSSFGRRPVLIASNLVVLASMIWRARATTYNSFMGACVLNGIGAGPAETIQPAVIADIFFLHDRGFWNTFYWVFYMGSLMVAPSQYTSLIPLLRPISTCLAGVAHPATVRKGSFPSSGPSHTHSTSVGC